MTPHHQMVDDYDYPDHRRPTPTETLAAARQRIRRLPTDRDGNVHVSDVLDALTDDSTN